MTGEFRKRAALLHRDALVWDNHACMPHRIEAGWMERLEAHRAAGVNVVSLNLGDADVSWEVQMAMARHFTDWVEARPETYVMGHSLAEIADAQASGQVAVVFDVEGGKALDGDLSLITRYHALGVKWMALVFNRANGVGGGVHDDIDTGLTAFGRQMVRELQRVGITVCCSHTGYRTANDVFDIAQKPVIFSHSNPRTVHDHPRNIPDDLIKRCAASGGVVGINGLSIFLGGKDRMAERFLTHIQYVADLVGPAHVGIGLDYVFDQYDMNTQLEAARGTWPAGYGYEPGIRYLGPEILPNITEMLLQSGWSETDIRGVLGENFQRVAKATW